MEFGRFSLGLGCFLWHVLHLAMAPPSKKQHRWHLSSGHRLCPHVNAFPIANARHAPHTSRTTNRMPPHRRCRHHRLRASIYRSRHLWHADRGRIRRATGANCRWVAGLRPRCGTGGQQPMSREHVMRCRLYGRPKQASAT